VHDAGSLEEGAAVHSAVAACAHALVAHMATHPVQSERSSGYQALRSLLGALGVCVRWHLIVELLGVRVHPQAAALLLHAAKEAHIEARSGGGGVPSAEQLFQLARERICVDAGFEEAIEESMSALNVLRYLLGAVGGGSAHSISRELVESTRRERTSLLDALLRRQMDAEWARGDGEANVSFVRLQVALSVVERLDELLV
jgi:hypothetical protein